MLTDADKANQRAFDRKITDLINLLHDLGGTNRNAKQFSSPELAYAAKNLRQAGHWVRDHYFTNIISRAPRPERPTTYRRKENGAVVGEGRE